MVVNVTLLNKDLIVKKVGLVQVQMQEDLDLGEIKTGERMVYLIAVRIVPSHPRHQSIEHLRELHYRAGKRWTLIMSKIAKYLQEHRAPESFLKNNAIKISSYELFSLLII